MTEQSPPRLHALDNLRALMMWFGIVIHSSLIYTGMIVGVPWHDNLSTGVADALVLVIHTFRMPVFFILAGFFAALLLHRRGPEGMARNRFQRLLVPFAAFYVPLLALQWLFASLFVHRMFHGSWGIDLNLNTVPSVKSPWSSDKMALLNTMHLWFIWILMGLSFATALLYRPLSRLSFVPRVGAAISAITGHGLGFAVLALPTILSGIGYPGGVVDPRQSFLPPLTEWLHYGTLFTVGLCIYHHQDRILPALQRRWLWNALAGAAFFAGTIASFVTQQPKLVLSFSACATMWLWSLAFIGAALRHFDRKHRVLDYLAASSYFVYLVHMCLTIAFGLLLFQVDLPALLKLVIVVAATTAMSLVAYHYGVRSTFIGQMLNGKRYPRKSAAPVFLDTATA